MEEREDELGDRTEVTKYWSEKIASNIKTYLLQAQYPSDLPPSESDRRRNFRKRAKDFVVQDDQLYYKVKKDGSLRLAISSQEEQQRIFEVHHEPS